MTMPVSWRDRATEAAVGGAAGLAINVLYIAVIGAGVSLGEWLQFAGVFLGVAATIGGTLWLQHHAAETKRRADAAAFALYLDRADDALHAIIDGEGDAWQYVAAIDNLLLYAVTVREAVRRRTFKLDVSIAALDAAWRACHPDMDRWANRRLDDPYDHSAELEARAKHIQELLREVISELNKGQ